MVVVGVTRGQAMVGLANLGKGSVLFLGAGVGVLSSFIGIPAGLDWAALSKVESLNRLSAPVAFSSCSWALCFSAANNSISSDSKWPVGVFQVANWLLAGAPLGWYWICAG